MGPILTEKLIVGEYLAVFILKWSPGYYKNWGGHFSEMPKLENFVLSSPLFYQTIPSLQMFLLIPNENCLLRKEEIQLWGFLPKKVVVSNAQYYPPTEHPDGGREYPFYQL